MKSIRTETELKYDNIKTIEQIKLIEKTQNEELVKSKKTTKNLKKNKFQKILESYMNSETIEPDIERTSKMKEMKRYAENIYLNTVFSDFFDFLTELAKNKKTNYNLPKCQFGYFFAEALSRVKEEGGEFDFCRLILFYSKEIQYLNGTTLTVGYFNTSSYEYRNKKNIELEPKLAKILDDNINLIN